MNNHFGIFLVLINMTSRFIAGVVTGIYISTKYNFKPYVGLIEDKIKELHKELGKGLLLDIIRQK